MPEDFTTATVRALIEQAAALDPPVYVSMDPNDVNPPGAWLAIDGVRGVNLAGDVSLRCSLYLIAPDNDPERALGLLVPLFQQIVPALLTTDGEVTTIGVVLPGDPTPLPALRLPVNL